MTMEMKDTTREYSVKHPDTGKVHTVHVKSSGIYQHYRVRVEGYKGIGEMWRRGLESYGAAFRSNSEHYAGHNCREALQTVLRWVTAAAPGKLTTRNHSVNCGLGTVFLVEPDGSTWARLTRTMGDPNATWLLWVGDENLRDTGQTDPDSALAYAQGYYDATH